MSHFVVVFASATKRNVKIQLHVCNLHYTKESLGLYRSTFPSNMIISWTQIFSCIKKEEYDCIPISIDIIPYYGIGRIVHSTNLCAYIIAQKKQRTYKSYVLGNSFYTSRWAYFLIGYLELAWYLRSNMIFISTN